MNYQAIVKGMNTSEINTRINNTGSEDFKEALEAELKARGEDTIEGTVVEQPESVQEKSLEETNTNTKVEEKEPETVAVEAELKARGEDVIEGTVVEQPESVQEESSEGTDTNAKVEDKEPETVAVEAPKPKRTRRSKTSQEDSE